MSKLTRAQRLEIRQRLNAGEKAKALAAEFGISKSYTYNLQTTAKLDFKCIFPTIKEFAKERHMTARDLADAAGFSESTLKQILNGTRNPSKRSIDKLLALTGLSYEETFRK